MLEGAVANAIRGGRAIIYTSAAGRADVLFAYLHGVTAVRAQAADVDLRVTLSASRRAFKLTNGGKIRIVLVQRADYHPDAQTANDPPARSYCDAGVDQEIRRLVTDGWHATPANSTDEAA